MADEINLDVDPHTDAEVVPFPSARAVQIERTSGPQTAPVSVEFGGRRTRLKPPRRSRNRRPRRPDSKTAD